MTEDRPTEFALWEKRGQLFIDAWTMLDQACYVAPSLEVFLFGREERQKHIKRSMTAVEYASWYIDELRAQPKID